MMYIKRSTASLDCLEDIASAHYSGGHGYNSQPLFFLLLLMNFLLFGIQAKLLSLSSYVCLTLT